MLQRKSPHTLDIRETPSLGHGQRGACLEEDTEDVLDSLDSVMAVRFVSSEFGCLQQSCSVCACFC